MNKRSDLLIIFGCLVLLPVAAKAATGSAAMRENFDEPSLQSCIGKRLAEHYAANIGPYGVRGSQGVRVSYAGSNTGSKGVVFSCPLAEPATAYTLQFSVRFDHEFQFVKGGKLHGLGPAHVMSGGKGTAPDGWSARVLFLPGGGVGIYYYNQDQVGRYGQMARAENFRFQPGQYYRLKLNVQVNSSANASDGSLRLYVNDDLIVTRENIRFRGVDGEKALVSRMLFSTFHGGSTPAWAPKDQDGNFVTVQADFDEFVVSRPEP